MELGSARPIRLVIPTGTGIANSILLFNQRIPDGTLVEIEAPYRVNLKEFKPNDEISLRVINPIKINGVVIEQGAKRDGPH